MENTNINKSLQIENIEGDLIAKGLRFAIISARFNDFFTDKLAEGAIDTLIRHGCNPSDIVIYRVPGSFEVPIAAKKIAKKGGIDALIALSALIRGATPHFDYIAGEVTKGIAQVGLEFTLPIAYGIITVDNIEQAIERSGTKAGNKGSDAALSAIEMANLFRKII